MINDKFWFFLASFFWAAKLHLLLLHLKAEVFCKLYFISKWLLLLHGAVNLLTPGNVTKTAVLKNLSRPKIMFTDLWVSSKSLHCSVKSPLYIWYWLSSRRASGQAVTPAQWICNGFLANNARNFGAVAVKVSWVSEFKWVTSCSVQVKPS